MGCNCSREEARVVVSQQIHSTRNTFIIKINIPNSDRVKIVMYESKVDFMLLSELINNTLFFGKNADELDANFISIYDNAKEDFDYYIQRLAGIEMENEDDPLSGKIWVVYINKEPQNWSALCSQNIVVRKDDEIELKYEKFTGAG